MFLLTRFEPLLERAKKLLSHKYFSFILASLAVLLAWPSVQVGWFADDVYHRAAYVDAASAQPFYLEEDRLMGPMRMYSFFEGDTERFQRALDIGTIPWWSPTHIHATFWRPLTGLMSELDYFLWPESSALMHVHSLFWFFLLIVLAAAFYKDAMGPGWAAGLAALLFAVNDAQIVPITFLANRHILLGAVFGIAALLCHHRWRIRHQLAWGLGALLFLSLSLLSSESGVSILAYLLAYAIFLETGSFRARALSLLPYVLLIAVWRAVYVTLDYGIWGIGLYVDPGREPLRFIGAAWERLPVLWLSAATVPLADIYALLTPLASHWVWFFAVAVLVTALALFFPLWRYDRIAHFWLLGVFLSAIPLCSSFPCGRILTVLGFGAMGFIAQITKNANDKRAAHSAPPYLLGLLICLILLRLVIGTGALTQNGRIMRTLQAGIDRATKLDLSDPQIEGKDLIFVNSPFPLIVSYTIPFRIVERQPLPAHIRVLASGLDPMEIERPDAYTLTVRPQGGFVCPPDWSKGPWYDRRTYLDVANAIRRFEHLLINPSQPWKLGNTVTLTNVQIQIAELTEDQRPAEATFHFDAPLEDSSLVWLQWNQYDWKYEPFTLPPVGQTVRLE